MEEFDARAFAESYLVDLQTALSKLDLAPIHLFADAVEEVMDSGATIHFIGNGGSAGTPSHSAGDWSKELTVPTLCHVDNISGLTAWANDTDYDNVFVGALKTFLRKGDIVVGYSGSGNSANVINGLKYAKEKGCKTIGVGGDYKGGKGGKMAKIVDIPIVAETKSMERIEDIQLVVNHIVKETIKARRGIEGGC